MRRRWRWLAALAALAAALVVAGAVGYLHSQAFRATLERRVASEITRGLGRDCRLRLVDLRPFALTAEFEELWIAGADEGAPAFLELDRIRVDAGWRRLLQRRLVLSELSIDGLRIDLDQLPSPPVVEPDPPASPLTFEDLAGILAVDQATLSDGVVRWADKAVPVSLRAEGISLRLERDGGEGDHRLRLDVARGTVDLPDLGAIVLAASGDAELTREGVRLSGLDLEGAGLDLHLTGEWTDLPALAGKVAARLEARPEDLGNTLPVLGDVRGAVTAEATSGFSRAGFDYEASLTSSRLAWRGGSADQVVVALEGSPDGWRSTLSASVLGTRLDAEFHGAALPGSTPFETRVSFRSEDIAGLLDATLASDAPEISGSAQGWLTARVDAFEPTSVRGRYLVESRIAGSGRFPSSTLSSTVTGTIEDGRFTIERLQAEGAGLSLEGRGFTEIEGSTDFRVDLKLRDTQAALGVLRSTLERRGIAGRLSHVVERARGKLEASASLTGPGIKAMTLDAIRGSVDVEARGLTLVGRDGLPLDLTAKLALEKGRLAIPRLVVIGAGVRIDGAGWGRLDGTLGGKLGVEIAGLGDTTRRVLTELRVVGLPTHRAEPALRSAGSLRLDADVEGHWSRLDGRLTLSGDGLGTEGVEERRTLRAEADLRQGRLDARVRLEGETSSLVVETQMASYVRPGAAAVDIEVLEGSPDWWAGFAGEPPPLQGVLEASARYDLASRAARGRFDIRAGSISGFPFELHHGVVDLSWESVEIESAELRIPGGVVAIDGNLGPQDGRAALRIRSPAFDLGEALATFGMPIEVKGLLDVDARLTGTPTDPTMLGRISLADLELSGRTLPPLAGAISFARGEVEVDLAQPDGDSALSLRGQLQETAPWSLQLRYPLRVDLNALTGMTEPAGPAELDALVVAELRGRALLLDTVEGQIELRDARMSVDDNVLVAESGPTITLQDSRATIAPFRIRGRGVDVVAEGDVPFDPEQPVAGRAEGSFSLALLSGRVAGLKLDGDSELEVRLDGTLAMPVWRGTVGLKKARLSYPALPAPLDEIDATLVLTAERWTIDDLAARFGGGRLTGSGTYLPSGENAGRLRLALAGERIRVPLIEGLRSEFGADLTLEGRFEESLELAGSLRFARAAYVQDIDLKRQLTVRTRGVVSGTEVGGVLDRIRLDLVAEAPGTLSVRNNLASIDTTATLKIAGTAAQPLVTGEVTVEEGGRVFFRDVSYYVSRGRLEYVADPPSNPALDIEAQTTVAKYDVNLLLTGRLEDPKSELSSDPPLSQADIVSLLVTGRTRDEFGAASGGLAETQAALYLGSSFTRETEQALRKSLGLDQVRIDPVLVAGETDPTARVTLGKTLSAKTSVTYSRALGGAQGDVYELRYGPFPRVSIVGARDEDGDHSLDAIHTRRFFQGPSSPDERPPTEREQQPIVRLTIVGAGAITEKRLRREMGLRKGEPFRRPRLAEALDAVREQYAALGFPEVDVEATVTPESDGVAIVTAIEEGRRVEVDVQALDGGKRVENTREIREAVLTSWQRSVFVEDIADAAAERIRRTLADRGFLDAEVQCELVDLRPTGAKFDVRVRRGPRVRVERIVLVGNREIDEERIRAEMLTEESGFLSPKWLSAGVLEDDREAVRALYRSLGYLDIAVGEAEIMYPRSEGRAHVRITVEEGSGYRLGEITFSGNGAVDVEGLRSAAALQSGAIYLDAQVKAARARVRDHFDDRGFPQVRIDTRTTIERDAARVDLKFVIDAGPRKTIESVEVVGARLTRPKVIQRELELTVGAPLSADLVAATRQKLYRTGLFQSVTVVEKPGQSEGDVRVEVQVEERSNVQTETGLGVSSDDGLRGRASVSHSNLGGRRLYGSLGGRASQNDWRLFGLLRQPTLFGSPLEGVASTFVENEERDSYDVRRIGSTLQLDSKPENRSLRWFVGYGLESVDVLLDGIAVDSGSVLPPDLQDLIDSREETTVRLGNVYTGFVAGNPDDFTWPTRGSVLRTKLAAFAPAFLSEAEFVSGFAQWSLYRRVAGRRLIWSSGLRLGLADTFGDTAQIPTSERFFLGGDNSLRGFARDSVVALGFPTEELAAAGVTAEDSLGGNSMLVVNQELIAPLLDPVSLVLFYDAGNLYWQLDDFALGDLRHSAGLGLRVKTPAGPLRLEYGWKLDRQPEESRGRFHLSLGIPF